jgi:TRAP-type uncharacterized transport system fused permease subunit
VVIPIVAGIISLGALGIGYMVDRLTRLERFILGIATFLMFIPGLTSSTLGLTLLIGVYVRKKLQVKQRERTRVAAATTT